MQRRVIPSLEFEDLIRNCFLSAAKILEEVPKKIDEFQDREIKLRVDSRLDLFFRNCLEKHTPYPVYSEESKGNSLDLSKTCWIVDPLDGSLNFFRGIPFYTSSIALWIDGKPKLGYIYDYAHQEFYSADVDGVAKLNDQILQIKALNSHQIKATGIPSHSEVESSISMFIESLKSYKKLRWLGCASLSLAYLASNRLDAYEERGIKIWDVAAGLALVLAAGGKVQIDQINATTLNVVATNG